MMKPKSVSAAESRLREIEVALRVLCDEYGPNVARMRIDAPRRKMWMDAIYIVNKLK